MAMKVQRLQAVQDARRPPDDPAECIPTQYTHNLTCEKGARKKETYWSLPEVQRRRSSLH